MKRFGERGDLGLMWPHLSVVWGRKKGNSSVHTWRSRSFASRTLLSPVLSDDFFAAAFIPENHSWNSFMDSLGKNMNEKCIQNIEWATMN